MGGNPEAAVCPYPLQNVLTFVYALSGFTAGLAGVVSVGRLASANGNAGSTYDTDAIAACIIGGASFTGGKGTIWGTLIGALLMAVIRNGLNLMGAQTNVQYIVIGAVIILAVTIDVFRNKAEAKAEDGCSVTPFRTDVSIVWPPKAGRFSMLYRTVSFCRRNQEWPLRILDLFTLFLYREFQFSKKRKERLHADPIQFQRIRLRILVRAPRTIRAALRPHPKAPQTPQGRGQPRRAHRHQPAGHTGIRPGLFLYRAARPELPRRGAACVPLPGLRGVLRVRRVHLRASRETEQTRAISIL